MCEKKWLCFRSCFFPPQCVMRVLGGNWIFGRFGMAHYFTGFRYRLCQFQQFSVECLLSTFRSGSKCFHKNILIQTRSIVHVQLLWLKRMWISWFFLHGGSWPNVGPVIEVGIFYLNLFQYCNHIPIVQSVLRMFKPKLQVLQLGNAFIKEYFCNTTNTES